MGTHRAYDDQGRTISIITIPDIYRYGGFIFEIHRYCGPCKLRADLEPAKKMGPKFWKVWGEWDKLTPAEKLETQILG